MRGVFRMTTSKEDELHCQIAVEEIQNG
jgi:hypothetical protein